ncbi:hypothetical protein M409DRAFT_51625 [Zasmidium cellare ATCC 36951]|uniref:AAA+ ATPase domain-containing protein n=1 Tax=Zasmidium cellare ATCC 36951 TaxID=1080233 RepID=A0A6A6CTN3_ZASCE|nr:uncharacterized protein M409DRAFT_51625 [Zasmidium cellare ATCC 36951]KAF2170617.1 hypothetical protein M409DRAFT_51625 [Zasmidium cellare ATCC 36951]
MGDRGRSTTRHEAGHNAVYDHYTSHFSERRPNSDVALLEAVRSIHPENHVTSIGPWDCDLIGFAGAGHAKATLRRHGNRFNSQRTYSPPRSRMEGGRGTLGKSIAFGLYDYSYDGHDLQVYSLEWPRIDGCGTEQIQYILTPSIAEEDCPVADGLIEAAGKWTSELHEEIYVFDAGNWDKSKLLWESVQSASWDDVILDPATKDGIINDVQTFFDNRSLYEDFGVQWKRGIIFHGHPGCGKTITIKALMRSLQQRNVASLYVKSFKARQGPQYAIREIFEQARKMAPCLLIFEDLDSLVVDKVRSYFLNEVDGLEKNDGILMIGSTNHLERLDPGISKRPSRFDRKYYYKLPDVKERISYGEYWRNKLRGKIEFDEAICDVVAQLTEGFSFAYLQELFVQTLLSLVGGRTDADDDIEIVEEVDPSQYHEQPEMTKDATDTNSADKSESGKGKKAVKQMPEVTIPEHLQSDPLMLALHKQAKALWRDLDSSEDSVHRRSKVSGVGDEDDESDDDSDSGSC